MMRTFVAVPPGPVVSWEEAEQHLRLGGDDSERRLVEAQIAAATQHLDGPTGWLGRSIGLQTLEARLDTFDAGCIRLRYLPIVDIESVKYIDTAGVEQVIAPGNYELQGSALVPAYGSAWPAPRMQREAVRIRYRAGYYVGDEVAGADPLPATIRAAILLMVGDLFDNRETAEVTLSSTVDNLLAPLRVWY